MVETPDRENIEKVVQVPRVVQIMLVPQEVGEVVPVPQLQAIGNIAEVPPVQTVEEEQEEEEEDSGVRRLWSRSRSRSRRSSGAFQFEEITDA